MPAGDRTGPAGMGPMTGRGMGLCSGNQAAGTFYGGGGRGRMGGRGGRGGRGGAGFRRGGYGFAGAGYSAPMNDRGVLEAQLEALRRQTSALEERLQGMDREDQA